MKSLFEIDFNCIECGETTSGINSYILSLQCRVHKKCYEKDKHGMAQAFTMPKLDGVLGGL